MALQNRVLPTGEIVAAPWRGGMMGNRGCLHDGENRLQTARWRHKNWVACLLEFRGRWREVMPKPGAPTIYTALFFWDEAAAFAAGHRPCGECRNADYRRFRALWEDAGLPSGGAGAIDRELHAHRVRRDRSRVRIRAATDDLPVGTFVLAEGPALIGPEGPLAWTPEGYRPTTLPGEVEVLTPAPILDVFRQGYRPVMRLP